MRDTGMPAVNQGQRFKEKQLQDGAYQEKSQPIEMVNSMVHSLYKDGLADNVVADIFKVELPSGNALGLVMDYCLHGFNGTNWQVHTGQVMVGIATDDGASYDDSVSAHQHTTAGTGTLTDTWAVSVTGLKDGEVKITLNPNSTLTGTPVMDLHLQVWMTGKWRLTPL